MECFKKYLVEFIGTFFLVFTVGCAVLLSGNGVIPAIAIGFVLMVMVYAGGYISGGHYNPAVSLACAIRGALEWKQLVQYWISQILGAVCASLIVVHFATNTLAECPYSTLQIIIGEFLFTFALCYVVLNAATTKKNANNSYYGLAIGSTVTAGAFVTGAFCYGAFNPAVAVGLNVMSIAGLSVVGITVAVNLIAAVAAALIFKFVTCEEE